MNETIVWIAIAFMFPFIGLAFLTFTDWIIKLILQVKEWHDFYAKYHVDVDYSAWCEVPDFDPDEDGIVI